MTKHVLSAAGMLLLAACSSPQLPVDVYTLLEPAALADPAPQTVADTMVLVPEAAAYGVFAEQTLIERRGLRLVRDAYRVWSPRPTQMLSLGLADALSKNGIAASARSVGDARWALQTTIRDWSYERSADGLTARVEIEAQLVDIERRTALCRQRFVRTTPAASGSYDALMAAFKESLDGMCADCVQAVKPFLAKAE